MRSNFLAVSGAQLLGYVIPILEIPLLARALGPDSYSQIALIQSISLIFSLVIEFGFGLSASRQIVLVKNNKDAIGRITSEIYLAKAMLASACAFGLAIFVVFMPQLFSEISTSMLILSIVYSMSLGFSPFWVYQGLEKMIFPVMVDISVRSVCLCALFLLVKSSSDGLTALTVLAISGFLNTFLTTVGLIRLISFRNFCFGGAIQQIKTGLHVFIYKSANTILLSFAPAVIAIFASKAQVGIYIPAEKMVKGIVGLATPVITVMFPLLARLFVENPIEAKKKSWQIVFGFLIFGIFTASVICIFAAPLIFLLLGPGFESAASVLQILIWLVPVRMGHQAIGFLMLISTGRDKMASGFFSLFTCGALISGGILTYFWGVRGMASGLVLFELCLLCLIGVIVWKQK